MRSLPLLLLAAVTLVLPARAQWEFQQSHTTASLRGIQALGNGVAWASGTAGTVLHTTDDGATWQTCPVPPQAEKLDFRAVQAFDANTAIVMSAGKGDLSRLYKTTDACKTWRLLLNNPDPEGFWDALQFGPPASGKKSAADARCFGTLLGDPVRRSFVLFLTYDCGEHWERQLRQPLPAQPDEAIFAASNTSLAFDNLPSDPVTQTFVTGGPSGPRVINLQPGSNTLSAPYSFFGARSSASGRSWQWNGLPTHKPSASAGAFSFAHIVEPDGKHQHSVVVGGDFKQPNNPTDTAWFLDGPDNHAKWTLAQTPPRGYRSAVAYHAASKTWIAVGPTGTDLSTDHGRNWKPLTPQPTSTANPPKNSDAASTPTASPSSSPAPQTAPDKDWNALSLPFVVGPHGRIAKLTLP